MSDVAKIFRSGGSQAVRIPAKYRLNEAAARRTCGAWRPTGRVPLLQPAIAGVFVRRGLAHLSFAPGCRRWMRGLSSFQGT